MFFGTEFPCAVFYSSLFFTHHACGMHGNSVGPNFDARLSLQNEDQELLLMLKGPCDVSSEAYWSQLLVQSARYKVSDTSQQASESHLVIAVTPNSALGKEPSINLDATLGTSMKFLILLSWNVDLPMLASALLLTSLAMMMFLMPLNGILDPNVLVDWK